MMWNDTRWRCCATTILLATAMFAAAAAQAVEVAVKYAWMRPAAATTTAQVYVEISSDTALMLTGASSPVAKRTEIVLVERTDGTDEGHVVKSLPVSATAMTRLAYRGSHLRFVDMTEDVANASKVPLTLEFADVAGNTYRAATTVQVRGIMRPQPPAPSEPAPAPSNGGPGTPAGGDAPGGRM